jgi:predicted nucleic acid-binding protein
MGSGQGTSERQGKKMPVMDGLIAITALMNNATVVTRNIADMIQSGAPLFNPWEGHKDC